MLGDAEVHRYDRVMFRPISTAYDLPVTVAAPVAADSALDFVSVDVETACGRVSSICQIGIVGFKDGKIAFEYETLIDPRDYFSSFNTRIHGITQDHVAGKPCFGDLPRGDRRTFGGPGDGRPLLFRQGCAYRRLPGPWPYADRGDLARQRAGRQVRLTATCQPPPQCRLQPSRHPPQASRCAERCPRGRTDRGQGQRGNGHPHSRLAAVPKRAPAEPAPKPAPDGPLIGQRVAMLGEPRHGELAHRIAAQGGRIVAAVGKTTTMLVVCADEPFGYIRCDAQFRRARELQDSGHAIEILSTAALGARYSDL